MLPKMAVKIFKENLHEEAKPKRHYKEMKMI